jgi:hypothetical protein
MSKSWRLPSHPAQRLPTATLGRKAGLSCIGAIYREAAEERKSGAGGLFNRCHDCYISRRGSFPRFPFFGWF